MLEVPSPPAAAPDGREHTTAMTANFGVASGELRDTIGTILSVS